MSFVTKEMKCSLKNVNVCQTHFDIILDAVKRRTLPAWIREGLEKMDREKQKKLEQERIAKERAEMANDNGKEQEADEEGDGPRVPRKSKFVRIPFVDLNGEYLT